MAFEWPDNLHLTTKQRVASLLWALQQCPGGEVTDPSGFATNALNDACRKAKVRQIPRSAPGVYPNLIAKIAGGNEGPWMTNALIEREVNGKRTYAIRLLVDDDDLPEPDLAWTRGNMPPDIREAWYPDDVDTEPSDENAPVVEVEAVDAGPVVVEEAPAEIERVPVVAVEDVELDDPGMTAGGLPTTMLGRVLTISNLATELMINLASHGSEPSRSDQQLRDQLAWALDENERVRRQLTAEQDAHRATAELVQAKDAEIKALRQSLRITQANLETLRSNAIAHTNGHVTDDDERQRQVLANLMRERAAVEA